MAEINVEQYEFLVGLIRRVSQQLTRNEEYWKQAFGDFQVSQRLQASSLEAIEQDLGKSQKDIREIAESIERHDRSLDGLTQLCKSVFDLTATSNKRHDEALDGLTQLCKTNFDLLESLRQHIHGESSSIDHERALSSERAQ